MNPLDHIIETIYHHGLPSPISFSRSICTTPRNISTAVIVSWTVYDTYMKRPSQQERSHWDRHHIRYRTQLRIYRDLLRSWVPPPKGHPLHHVCTQRKRYARYKPIIVTMTLMTLARSFHFVFFFILVLLANTKTITYILRPSNPRPPFKTPSRVCKHSPAALGARYHEIAPFQCQNISTVTLCTISILLCFFSHVATT